MRIRSWVAVVVALGAVLVLSWASITGADGVGATLWWAVTGTFVAALVWRVVRRVVRRDESVNDAVRDTIAPGVRGLGEVQDLYLGRPDVGPVVFGSASGPVPELVVDRPDPLDETTWRV